MVTITRTRADDPSVVPLVTAHVASMDDGTTPAEACHRLEPDELLGADITFFAAVDGDIVVGIGALAATAPTWAEVKSMHVVAQRRGEGISHLVLAAIEQAARDHGATWLRLETGTAMTAAIGLYRRSGFVERGPFGDYLRHPATVFMEKRLAPG